MRIFFLMRILLMAALLAALFVAYRIIDRWRVATHKRDTARLQRASHLLSAAALHARTPFVQQWLGSLSRLAKTGRPLVDRWERRDWVDAVKRARDHVAGTPAEAFVDEALATFHGYVKDANGQWAAP